MHNLAPQLIASADALAALGGSSADIDALDDASLLAGQRLFSDLQRLTQTYAVWIAAAIARRSDHSLGYEGLAKKNGFISPEALIQAVSGGTKADSVKFVQLGEMVALADDAAKSPELADLARWQTPIARSLSSGLLSADAADAIRKGLSGCDDRVASDDLRSAAEQLIQESTSTAADLLFRRARQLRDGLDAHGIAQREQQRRQLRYFTAKMRTDGLVAGSYLLSDEDAELMLSIYDEATSPRRVGPRFVDARDPQRAGPDGAGASAAGMTMVGNADAPTLDARTPGQKAADALTALLRIGVDADPGTVFGGRRPAVRVAVTQRARQTRTGHGTFESNGEPIAITTIDRFECDSGTIGVMFDSDGQVVNVGRDQRLFTTRQRVGLALRDGGCRFPGCERPVSWTEAHHIDEWQRDQGRTDIADGILLCRLHHMLVHDNHWSIEREQAEYWLVPPPDIDPQRKRRPMPSKSAIARQLAAVRPGGVVRDFCHHPPVTSNQISFAVSPEPGYQNDGAALPQVIPARQAKVARG
jgi:hypothetical protein